MKKHIFALVALLLAGVSAKATPPTAVDNGNIDRDSLKSALVLLIKSGSINISPEGQLKVDENLMQELRQQGLINASPMQMSSQCIDGSK
jgi:hypothetical protein